MLVNSGMRSFLLAIAALGLLTLISDLQPVAASGPGVPIGDPIAGPIEVTTEAEVVTGPVGSLLETTLVVENHGTDPAMVLLIGQIEWPDGSTQILRYGPPMTIDPDRALIITALSPIPAGVGSGEGTFTATAFVGALGHGGRGSYAGRLIAQDRSSFLIP